jgi:heavy metal translocating P-type ATPase
MEALVSAKAKDSLRALNKMAPTKAWVITEDGGYYQRSINEVKVGDLILIKSGEMIPLDGIVVEGASSVNLVHLTGENLPMTKKKGDTVPAGGRNLEGALRVQVTHTSHDSTLAKIITLVTQAEEAKPALAQWFDKLSRRYASTIIALAAFFAVFLPYWLNIPFLGEEGGIYRALAFLIAASPCALIIAIPIAYLSALSVAAKKGVLIKGGNIFDALATIKQIAFDKTGTLTTGELRCTGFEGDEALLSIAYALEVNANHPIAKAIQKYAEEKNVKPASITDFRTRPGYGVEAKTANGASVYVGNTDGIEPRLITQKLNEIETIKKEGDLIAIMRVDDRLYLFRFQDTPRPEAKKVLKSLSENRHLKLVMLTGDHKESAQKVAREMGVDDFRAEMKPEDKLRVVAELSEKEPLGFVGDGINDAPALARAAVGISMGRGGSRAAIDAADVILLHDDLERLDWLFGKAKQTESVVKQNLTIATLAIFIAAIPALLGFVPLWLAVIMHEGGTVIVGLNGLRLLKK